jgi:hypothetical protein
MCLKSTTQLTTAMSPTAMVSKMYQPYVIYTCSNCVRPSGNLSENQQLHMVY